MFSQKELLETKLIRKELDVIETLLLSQQFNTTKITLEMICLVSILDVIKPMLYDNELAQHKETFSYIQSLYLERYIEMYGNKPNSFYK